MPVYNRTLWVGDVHTPDHDSAALSAVYDVISSFKPEKIIFLGDFFDCYAMSRFSKAHRTNTAADDIEIGVELLAEVVARAKRARRGCKATFLLGNHEDRLLRRKKDEPDLGSFIDPMKVFKFKKVGIPTVKMYNEAFIQDGVYSTHGFLLRKAAGAGYMASLGMSGVTGHTHRLNSWSHTTARDVLTWCEAGHLLDNDKVSYGHHKDWQQGLVIGWSKSKTSNVRPYPVSIEDGQVTSGLII